MALTSLELKSAIVPNFLVVSPDTKVIDALAQMNGHSSGLRSRNAGAQSNCVLVLEDEQVIGILTERDVVRLSAQQQPLDELVMRQVMAHPVVTLRRSALADLFGVMELFQQRNIRHLPILDEQDRLVGVVTRKVCSKPLTPQRYISRWRGWKKRW